MNPALRTSATGMAAQQTRTEVIANNLANVNTTGFKRSRAQFEDLLYQTMQGPAVLGSSETNTMPAIQVGRGTRLAAVQALHASEVRTTADLNRRRRVRLRAAEDLRSLHRLIEQVLELRATTLEAGGIHVREIVRDDFGAGLLRGHAGRGGAEGGIHRVRAIGYRLTAVSSHQQASAGFRVASRFGW